MKVEDGSLRIRSTRTAHAYVGQNAAALTDGDGFVDSGDIVELRGERHVQFAYQSAKKVVTKNFPPADVDTPLDELLDHGFAGVHISLRTEEIDIRTSAWRLMTASISSG